MSWKFFVASKLLDRIVVPVESFFNNIYMSLAPSTVDENFFWHVTLASSAYSLFVILDGYSLIARFLVFLLSMVYYYVSSSSSTYGKYVQLRQELFREKKELTKISAQDEFARWARKRRQVDKLQIEFDQIAIKHGAASQIEELMVSGIKAIIKGIAVAWIAWWSKQFMGLGVMQLPSAWFQDKYLKHVLTLLRIPFAPEGSISASVWALAVHLSLKRLLLPC